MNPLHAANCARIEQLFEGREAIYDENGFWYVRVSNIRSDVAKCRIDADVEEIPTPALDIFRNRPRARLPERWEIGCAYLTLFSEDFWSAGIPMICWSMWFKPALVEEVLRMADAFPPNMDRAHRYIQIALCIRKHSGALPVVRAFPGADPDERRRSASAPSRQPWASGSPKAARTAGAGTDAHAHPFTLLSKTPAWLVAFTFVGGACRVYGGRFRAWCRSLSLHRRRSE
jgi:hypothetical protein